MRNDVTVGVMKWAGDQAADDANPPIAEVQQHWVQIGDVCITAEDHGLKEVSYGVTEVGGFSEVTITLSPSSFKTVDATEYAGATNGS